MSRKAPDEDIVDDVGGGEESFFIRPAGKEDIPVLLGLIYELASYENLESEAVATPELLARWMFDECRAEAILGIENGEAVGFALFFASFSTFLGKPGIYLEDLFVKPEFRGKGYGKLLLARLARLVIDRGWGRLEWSCLDWNKPSIQFYLSLGAVPMDGWTVYRLGGEELEGLAETEGPIPPRDRFGNYSGTKVFQ